MLKKEDLMLPKKVYFADGSKETDIWQIERIKELGRGG